MNVSCSPWITDRFGDVFIFVVAATIETYIDDQWCFTSHREVSYHWLSQAVLFSCFTQAMIAFPSTYPDAVSAALWAANPQVLTVAIRRAAGPPQTTRGNKLPNTQVRAAHQRTVPALICHLDPLGGLPHTSFHLS